MIEDRFDLERFVTAQKSQFDSIRAELKQGCKRGHWMWFIFPQLRGLGRSWDSNYYGISSRAEAEAYLEHPILGQRLLDCTQLVNLVDGRSIQEIFGEIDSIKFRSSMTLFAELDRDRSMFMRALEKYFDGQKDELTLDMLRRQCV